MTTLLNAALAYHRRGWSVFPLKFKGSIEDQKRPLIDSWDPYKTTPADEKQIRAWWARWPQANIALVTGTVSGLVVLDLDGPNAVALLHGQNVYLPKTAAVQTGKGYHALYRHPGVSVPNRAALLSDGNGSQVDGRGDGGYVVAPPSVHGTGRVYQWVVHPDEVLAEMPPALLALVTGPAGGTTSGPEDGKWVEEVMAGVPEGQRNETAARLAGYWLRVTHGDGEATLRAMRLWSDRCTPPMDPKELHTVVESIRKREAAKEQHETGKNLSRIPVIDGPQWADELRDTLPRRGVSVDLPGLSIIDGLVSGDFIVLAGRPGMGKSTYAAQLCVEACLRKHLPTYIVSSEMTRAQWGRWMAAVLAGTPTAQLPKPLPESLLAWFRNAPIGISDAGTMSIRDIRNLAEGRLGLKLLIVDHIGRVTGGRRDSRVLEVGDVARGLKALAKDLQCTVLALCQLNRRVEASDEKEPRLDDLRESGEIEQEADCVMFLWTPERDVTQAKLPGFLSVKKNRHGPLARIQTVFDKAGRQILTNMVRMP